MQPARATVPDSIVPSGGYRLDTELGIALKQADDLVRAQEFGKAHLAYKKAMLKAEEAGDEAMAALFHERAAMAVSAVGEAAKLQKKITAAGAAANAAHPATLLIPYADRGWKGVDSRCGTSRTFPNISLEAAK